MKGSKFLATLTWTTKNRPEINCESLLLTYFNSLLTYLGLSEEYTIDKIHFQYFVDFTSGVAIPHLPPVLKSVEILQTILQLLLVGYSIQIG